MRPGQGDGKHRGLNHFGHEGLVRRVIGGHWGLAPKLQALAIANKIEALQPAAGRHHPPVPRHRRAPAGTSDHRRPGHLRRSAQRRRQDQRPHHRGPGRADHHQRRRKRCSTNASRSTSASSAAPPRTPLGNITMEREALTLEALAIAMAAHNSGGVVIAQVERLAEAAQPASAPGQDPRASWSIAWWWRRSRSTTARPSSPSTTRPIPGRPARRWARCRRWR